MDIADASDAAVIAWLKRRQVQFEQSVPGIFLLPNDDLMLRIVQQLSPLDRRFKIVRLRERDVAMRLDQVMTLALRGEEMPGG